MRAGDLDTLLTPQAPSTAWSGGTASTTYANGTAFWAEVRQQPLGEAIRAGQVTGDLPAVVTYYADAATLTTDHRLTDGSTTYEVRSAPVRLGGPRGQFAQVLAVADPSGGA